MNSVSFKDMESLISQEKKNLESYVRFERMVSDLCGIYGLDPNKLPKNAHKAPGQLIITDKFIAIQSFDPISGKGYLSVSVYKTTFMGTTLAQAVLEVKEKDGDKPYRNMVTALTPKK